LKKYWLTIKIFIYIPSSQPGFITVNVQAMPEFKAEQLPELPADFRRWTGACECL